MLYSILYTNMLYYTVLLRGHGCALCQRPLQASCILARLAPSRGQKDHIDMNISTSHADSKAQYKGDSRNQALQDAYVHVVFWGPAVCLPARNRGA